MRALAIFVAGMAAGMVLLLVAVQVTGGWYTYVTQPKGMCDSAPLRAEVVPHQPNPCHYRYPRWEWLPVP